MNELKPEDVMPEGAVVEALEIRAPHDAVCRYALALLREKDATLEMCAETIERQDKELAQKDAEIDRLKNDLAISKKETKRYMTSHKQVRSEAITEFVEKLKERMREVYPADIYDSDIDQIAYELKGESK